MELIDYIAYVCIFVLGWLSSQLYIRARHARVGLQIRFPQPQSGSDWKPEDVAGAIIMFSEPVMFMGVQWYDRFGDVIHTDHFPFSNSLEERS